MRSRLAVPLAIVCAAATLGVAGARAPLVPRLPDPGGRIAGAALAAIPDGRWYGMDGHLHSDHSHDAGLFHQGLGKKPENHDTTVEDQLAEAARWGETFGTITDHRAYDQHYDPGYRSYALTLLDGEEWGGYPHATVWGLTEVLEQGADDGTCGVARAVGEAHAQDALFGIAHPEDGRADHGCITVESLASVALDHLEVWRAPHDGFWRANLAAGNRFPPSNGSDNHFRQLWGTEGGPGAMSIEVFAAARTQAAFVEAVNSGRTFATGRAVGTTITTLLDAEADGSFDAITGGSAVPPPGTATVRVAFRAELASGLWLQVFDETGAMVAQDPVTLPDEVLAYDLPAGARLYYGELAAEPVARVTGLVVHEYLAYLDTRRVVSSPVYLTTAAPVEDGTQATASGAPVRLSGDVPFAGFADVARSGDAAVASWQQRSGATYEVAIARSRDGGRTWRAPAVVSAPGEDARMPSVATDGSTTALVYEVHDRHAHGGALMVRIWDGEATIEVLGLAGRNARPSIAVAGGTVHLAWMSMEDGYKIRYHRWTRAGGWTNDTLLSSGAAADGPLAPYALPPRAIRHVPAAVDPVVVADGARVAVAWSENREDPTPLRNGTPDDWGIFAALSSDGGETWTEDARVSPRHDPAPFDPADPEDYDGNPARHPDLLLDGGSIYLAYQDRYGGRAQAYVQRSDDGGATWTAPALASASERAGEYSYRPKLLAGPVLVFQASEGRAWNLRTASSADGGATFSPEAPFTTGSGYAGFPAAAPGIVVWTGEQGGTYGVYAAAP